MTKIYATTALLTTLAFTFLATPNLASAEPISLNVTSIVYVTDGDTLAITTDTKSTVLVGNRFVVRIKGIDAPEIKAKCAAERRYAIDAKNELKLIINNANNNDNSIEVISHYKDRFGRIVGDLLIHQKNGSTINVGNHLMAKGLALPYSAKKRKNNYNNFWCN